MQGRSDMRTVLPDGQVLELWHPSVRACNESNGHGGGEAAGSLRRVRRERVLALPTFQYCERHRSSRAYVKTVSQRLSLCTEASTGKVER